MVCPVYRLGVLIVDKSIAQAAVPGTRLISILYAPQQLSTNFS
jgi:hypothetical protein